MPTAVPTLGPTKPKEATCTSRVGQNNHGTNLNSASIKTESFTECCYQCWITTGCAGYTWIKSNSQCWLKATIGDMRPDHLVVSGSPNVSPPSTAGMKSTISTTSLAAALVEASSTAPTTISTLSTSTILRASTVPPTSTSTGDANLTELIRKARTAI